MAPVRRARDGNTLIGSAGMPNRARYITCATLLAVSYLLIYGWLLARSDFLPYVMDNNESFSSLWHAQSMYKYGVGNSFGLADEAFSPHEAAHPYVHTHQGNFPRLFAFLIYTLGAQSIESQILVTTLIVGAATLSLMFLVFSRAGGPVFAFVVCLVFITDYVLFGQWQVVTYRVWHGFLLFSSLFCAQRLRDTKGARWRLLAAGNFACVFYFELVFATFVAIFTALYYAWLDRRAPLRVVLNWVAMGIGACTALVVLYTQAVGYLGWEGAVRDIYFTFLARNDFNSAGDFITKAAAFYETHNIIFWRNFQDRTQYDSIEAFVRSLTSFDWRVHTPLLSLLVWIIMLGWGIGLLPGRARNWVRSWIQHQSRIPIAMHIAGPAIFGASLFALIVLASRFDGVPLRGSIIETSPNAILPALISAILVCLLAVRWLGGAYDKLGVSAPTVAGARFLLLASGPVLAVSVLLVILPILYDQQYQPVWLTVQASWGPHVAGYTAVLAAMALALLVAVQGADAVFGEHGRAWMLDVLAILAAGFSAYAVVYTLSPGYIFTGYLYRNAPFTVFLTDIVVAMAMFTVWRLAGTALTQVRDAGARLAIGNACVSVGLAFYLGGYWLNLQWHYIDWLPPNHYAFLKTLAEEPYRGASFVVDNYAAPVAAYTGEWAYSDPAVQQGVVQRAGHALVLRGDDRYLWLADKATNTEYDRPRYYVCMIPQSFATVVAHLQSLKALAMPYPGCSKRGLVKLSMEKDPSLSLGMRLVAIDKEGPEKIGFDAWAIARLGWDDTAGLQRIDWSAMRTPK